MSLVKNLLTQLWKTEKENRQGNQLMKNLPISIKQCGRKTKGVCSKKKNLVGIKCYLVFSVVELQMVKLTNAGSSTLQENRSPATRRFLARENQTDLDTFLVALLHVFCNMSFC